MTEVKQVSDSSEKSDDSSVVTPPSIYAVPPETGDFESDLVSDSRRMSHDAHARELGIAVGVRFCKWFRMTDSSSKPFVGVVARPGKRYNRRGWLIHFEDDTWEFLSTWQVSRCVKRTLAEQVDTSKPLHPPKDDDDDPPPRGKNEEGGGLFVDLLDDDDDVKKKRRRRAAAVVSAPPPPPTTTKREQGRGAPPTMKRAQGRAAPSVPGTKREEAPLSPPWSSSSRPKKGSTTGSRRKPAVFVGSITKTTSKGWFSVRLPDETGSGKAYRKHQLELVDRKDSFRVGAEVKIVHETAVDGATLFAGWRGVVAESMTAGHWRKVRFEDPDGKTKYTRTLHRASLRVVDEDGVPLDTTTTDASLVGGTFVVVVAPEPISNKKKRAQARRHLPSSSSSSYAHAHAHARSPRASLTTAAAEREEPPPREPPRRPPRDDDLDDDDDRDDDDRDDDDDEEEAPSSRPSLCLTMTTQQQQRKKTAATSKRKRSGPVVVKLECECCGGPVGASDEGELLPCKHLVHVRCLNEHLLNPIRVSRKRSDGLADCPICKTYFNPQKRHCMLDFGTVASSLSKRESSPPPVGELHVDYAISERRRPSAKASVVSGEAIEFWQLQ